MGATVRGCNEAGVSAVLNLSLSVWCMPRRIRVAFVSFWLTRLLGTGLERHRIILDGVSIGTKCDTTRSTVTGGLK